ncbi:hypothetical protein ILUMI_22400 [Ignelater luminosus]|uniref:Uncharacterized protein n=1 Tax=Ignelater luminosus TaxID=2038154 RepID=A0A8K0G2Y2_IGNLU|nr:hypothetical protein ILUMI_22400 [Ignelater luminosus]
MGVVRKYLSCMYYREYLKEVQRRDLQNVLKLWKEAAKYLKDGRQYHEEEIWDQIDGIDDFNGRNLN